MRKISIAMPKQPKSVEVVDPRDDYRRLWLLEEQDVPPGPWSRRSDEEEIWYDRFLAYVALGPSRTVQRARKACAHKAGIAPVPHEREEWATEADRNEWFTRAAAWDAFIDEMVMRASAEAQIVLRRFAPAAALALVDALAVPQTRVAAAKEILDRAGQPATSKQEVSIELGAMSGDELDAEIRKLASELGYTVARTATANDGGEAQDDAVGQ